MFEFKINDVTKLKKILDVLKNLFEEVTMEVDQDVHCGLHLNAADSAHATHSHINLKVDSISGYGTVAINIQSLIKILANANMVEVHKCYCNADHLKIVCGTTIHRLMITKASKIFSSYLYSFNNKTFKFSFCSCCSEFAYLTEIENFDGHVGSVVCYEFAKALANLSSCYDTVRFNFIEPCGSMHAFGQRQLLISAGPEKVYLNTKQVRMTNEIQVLKNVSLKQITKILQLETNMYDRETSLVRKVYIHLLSEYKKLKLVYKLEDGSSIRFWVSSL